MDIELRHIRYFVAVAEELHFGRAARRLHLAQPPLSQQIRRLEEILGYPLFIRTSRQVKLTTAGELFLDRARSTLRKVHDDMEVARSAGRGELGFLTVGFIGSSMLTALPAMLGAYRRRHPRLNLQLREGYTSRVVEALIEGTVDVGFLRDAGPTDSLEVETLFSEPFVAVLPKHHPLVTKSRGPKKRGRHPEKNPQARHRALLATGDRHPATAFSARQLRDEPFVLFSSSVGGRAYDKTIAVCEEHGFRPHVVQEAPQWLTILRLVGAGLGVTIAPACVERIAAPDVVCRPLRKTTIKSDIELAYRTGDERSIVQAFCHMAKLALGI
jgi:DNA-binding transcriptional LysR family regulator